MASLQTTSESGDFGLILEDLARPPALAMALAVRAVDGPVRPFDAALQRAGQRAAGAHEPQPGDVLDGRYRITEVLGRGGMGVVLEAEQLRSQKRVAIKWMSARDEVERSAAQVERFLREARAVANIQHPNVVDLYDVGDCEGTPFLVLERLRGESLRKRLERGPMSWPELAPLMQGVLAGVGAVHAAGIVHRDLKPDNIFLARDGASVVPKILDFGVAAIRENAAEGVSSLTRTGALLGTPSYMALEQLTGGEVDKRADLYALGVLLYECLTGRLPFEARSAPELAVLLATRVAVPPSKLVSGLDRRLEVAILRALERQPDDRYPDVSTFASALSGDPNQSRGLRLRRHGVLGVLSLAAVLGAALWVQPGPPVASSATAETASPAVQSTTPAQVAIVELHSEPVHTSLEVPAVESDEPLDTVSARPRSAPRLDKLARPRRSRAGVAASQDAEAAAASETPRTATEIRVEDF